MYFVDRTAVVLKPTARFLEWLKSSDENMPDLTVEQLRTNCSVFLVPQFDEPESVISYFDERYQQIFEAELAGWDIDKSKWPQDMSLKAFWEFFDTEIHDMVLDILIVFLHLSALALCLAEFYGWMMWLGLAALAGSFAYAWHSVNFQTRNAVRKIIIDRQYRATVYLNDEEEGRSAVLQDSSMLTVYALFLQWNVDGKMIKHCILPDMADRDAYRRLKVWARWCREKEDKAELAADMD